MPFSRAIGEAVDRLQAIRYRPHFYREVLAFDLEGALRDLRVPLAVLEFCTAEEDAQIGRQGALVAEELGAVAQSAIELREGAPASLEDRPQDLATEILALRHAGFEEPVLYAGSWSEWCADPARPVARGE